MPHPALVERRVVGTFDDPNIFFDDVFEFDTGPSVRIDQRFHRGPERPAVYYDEVDRSAGFDSLLIVFDSMLVPFDDGHRYIQNFSSRNRDSRRRRPAVVVLG